MVGLESGAAMEHDHKSEHTHIGNTADTEGDR